MAIRRLQCKAGFGDTLLFILGWTLLTILTLGLALPFFLFSLIKFMINNTIIEE